MLSPRRQKLVHLNALRAFEAAARHLSFAAAAEELNVTPPAISQHIRALEEYLDAALFVRTKSGIALTPQARAAYPDIRDGLQQLAAGLTKLRGAAQDVLVTLTVPPSFAAKWLLPRIDRFRERHPDLDIRLDTTDRLADFAADGIDLGVRYGLGGYTDLQAEKLFEEEVFPVCSPSLLPSPPEQVKTASLLPLGRPAVETNFIVSMSCGIVSTRMTPRRSNRESYMRSLPASELVWLMASLAPSSDLPAFRATRGFPAAIALAAARLNAGTSSMPSI